MTNAQRDIKRKLRVREHAEASGNVSKTCRYFGISREAFCRWKRSCSEKEESGLINSKQCPKNPKLRTPKHVEEKILYLLKTYHLGQQRIALYLERYHKIKVAPSTVYNILVRNGLNRLPRNTR